MTSPQGAPVEWISSTGGPQMTVDAFINAPRLLPTQFVKTLQAQGFVGDQILRNAGAPGGPAVLYREDDPLYGDANGDIEYSEWAEIPVGNGAVGTPAVAKVSTMGLGMNVSERMRRWNQMSELNRRFIQLTNTVKDRFDRKVMDLFFADGSKVPTITLDGPNWDVQGDDGLYTGHPLTELQEVAQSVRLRKDADGNTYGYNPDTVLINDALLLYLTASQQVQGLFRGNIAGDNPLLNGAVTFAAFANWQFLPSPRVPLNKVAVFQRNNIGFIADERPLSATPLYWEAQSRETWRMDAIRWSAMALDNPLSGAIYTVPLSTNA